MAPLDTLCESELGAPVARGLFAVDNLARVHGLELADGRAVVVKLIHDDAGYLAAVQDVQRALAADGYPAPRPLFGPRALDGRLAVGEELLDAGTAPDGHDPATRAQMARELVRFITACRSFAERSELQRTAFTPALGSLWPRPHDVRFDFIATAPGAEWIDEVAAEVVDERYVGDGPRPCRLARRAPALRRRPARGGLRLAGLSVVTEPALAGYAAHGFTADWSVSPPAAVPVAEEALGFLEDYERARGASFSDAERACAQAALVYATAYGARCEHSDERLGIGFADGYRLLLRELAA